MDLLAPIANFFIDVIHLIMTGFTELLPTTPFQFEPLDWGAFGHVIGMFFPVGKMATHLTLILSAMLLYYAVRWGLRVIKMIQ